MLRQQSYHFDNSLEIAKRYQGVQGVSPSTDPPLVVLAIKILYPPDRLKDRGLLCCRAVRKLGLSATELSKMARRLTAFGE